MSGERALPAQASLRYLKVEAKRRHAAGEFTSLHLAQLAIAREHGQPSWTALKDAVDAAGVAAGREGHALAQLRWIVARFVGADEPGWLAPGEDELREHFTGKFLTAVPPGRLLAMITEIAPALRAELTVTADRPFLAHGRLAGHLVMAGNSTAFFHVLAYLPPTAPFAMPVLVSLGAAAAWQVALSAALSVACTAGVAWAATVVYRASILRTGRRVPLRELLAR